MTVLCPRKEGGSKIGPFLPSFLTIITQKNRVRMPCRRRRPLSPSPIRIFASFSLFAPLFSSVCTALRHHRLSGPRPAPASVGNGGDNGRVVEGGLDRGAESSRRPRGGGRLRGGLDWRGRAEGKREKEGKKSVCTALRLFLSRGGPR